METLTTIFFYIISFMLLISAIGVIFAKNIVNSALSGCLAFLSVSGIYFMLNATFNAVVQIAVYVVAVTILIVFAIMLTSRDDDKKLSFALKPRTFISIVSLLVLFSGIIIALWANYFEQILNITRGNLTLNKSLDSIGVIGEKLMTDYVLPFELISVLLLVLIVGVGLVCVVRKSGEKR